MYAVTSCKYKTDNRVKPDTDLIFGKSVDNVKVNNFLCQILLVIYQQISSHF